jgi:glycosyltransferase involved in cell wall biosynthesis
MTQCPPEQALCIPNFISDEEVAQGRGQTVPDWAERVFRSPAVVSVARLDPQKGLDVLIRAHAHLRRQGGTHNLLILGEGPLRAGLEDLALQLGVKESTFLPGFVPNPYALVKRASVFAVPSRFEGFCLAVVEAMLCGAPVVATNCHALVEVLDNGRYGRLVAIDDAPGLAKVLGEMLAEPSLRAAWAERAVAGGRRYFYPAVREAWEDVLLNTGHSPCSQRTGVRARAG